jgi:hypothetical protein
VTAEQAAAELWALRYLPKRVYIPRVIAILQRFARQRRAA